MIADKYQVIIRNFPRVCVMPLAKNSPVAKIITLLLYFEESPVCTEHPF